MFQKPQRIPFLTLGAHAVQTKRLNRYRGWLAEDDLLEQLCRSRRELNARAEVAGGDQQIVKAGNGADKRAAHPGCRAASPPTSVPVPRPPTRHQPAREGEQLLLGADGRVGVVADMLFGRADQDSAIEAEARDSVRPHMSTWRNNGAPGFKSAIWPRTGFERRDASRFRQARDRSRLPWPKHTYRRRTFRYPCECRRCAGRALQRSCAAQ